MASAGKILIILLLALVLRFISLNQSLWLDEAIGAIAARDYSYGEIVTKFILFDNHTPGYYLLLKFWASVLGSSEIALRSLSVVFGVLTVCLVYKIKKTAALLLATSQIHVYFSQEARMYAMAAFFATLAMVFFIKALKTDKNSYWLVFSASLLGMVASDYMPLFLLPAFALYVFFKKPKLMARLLLSHIPLLVFGVLWLPTLLAQFGNYSAVADGFLFGGATFKQAVLVWTKFVFGRISFEPKLVYYLLVAAASVPVVLALTHAAKTKKTLLFWLWLAIPLVTAFMASFFFPAFGYFRFIYVLPAFYILIALGINKLNVGGLLLVAVLMFNFVGLAIYYFDERQQREQWREAVLYVEKEKDEGAIALFEFSAPFAPYEWYAKGDVEAAGATDSILAKLGTEERTRNLLKGKNKIYYFEYLRDVSDSGRLVEKVIHEDGFVEVAKTAEFTGVGAITVYEKEAKN